MNTTATPVLNARPWRTLSSRLLRTTPWFAVRQDDVLRPDGSAGVYERIDSRGAVTVLAIDTDNQVAITRQWIYLHDCVQWRLPSGGIDENDPTPLDAAQRELGEETGLRAARWTPLGRLNCADSLTNHVVHLFLATDLTHGRANLDPCESDLSVHWLPLRTAVAMAMNNEIPDVGSAHALIRYAARLAGLDAADPVR